MNIDYARLISFLVASTFIMALGTHVILWIYGVVRRSVLRREAVRFAGRDKMFLETLAEAEEDEEIERRRAVATSYPTYAEFAEATRGGIPIDNILDRCNGLVPSKTVPSSGIPSGSIPPWVIAVGGIGLIFGLLCARDPDNFIKCWNKEADEARKKNVEDARRKLRGIQARMNKA